MRFLSLSIVSAVVVLMVGCAGKKPVVSANAPPSATAPALPSANAPAVVRVPAASPSSLQTATLAQTQQDQAMIEAARQAYKSGVALYQSSKYQQARADFDRAVNIFLTSGRDLKADPALDDAFEHMVDRINALELDSVQEGNGFSEQEQTPVGVANDVTFPVDPNLLARARAELKVTQSDLPLVVNDYVASYINYFTNTKKGHYTIENSLAREGRYRATVEKTLTDAGVPKDLIFLAIAESGFRPRAVNRHTGAGGMWQFMPHGSYGLARNGWVDERFDPEKSTRAYARYIKELHAQFGDWYLAMAAYDWGPGKVQRAVQRTGYADFWELYQRNVLPAETKNYVPIILAAAIMAKNPTQYGLTDVPVDPPLLTDTVTTDSEINLQLVGDLVGTTTDEIQQLNPSLLRMSTPSDMPYDLHLPPGSKDLFTKRLAMIPEEHRNSWRYRIAAQGDTLGSIAQTFHVKAAELAMVNQIRPNAQVQTGEALAIPVPPARFRDAHMRYRVRRGDTMVTVADRFGVTTNQLRRWNRIRGNRVPAGRLLYVSQPVRIQHARVVGHTSARHRTIGTAGGTAGGSGGRGADPGRSAARGPASGHNRVVRTGVSKARKAAAKGHPSGHSKKKSA